MKLPLVQASSAGLPRRRGALATSALALTFALGLGSVPVAAQDGTGAATPTPPSACEVVPAQVTSQEQAAPAQPTETPAATPSASPMASPVGATPVASPVVETTPETVAGDPLGTDLEAAATAIAGCLSDANYDELAQITGDLYRGQLVGLAEPLDPADFLTLSVTLPHVPVQVLSVEEAEFTGETTATAVVTYEMAHQVRTSSWEFELTEVRGTQTWVVQGETGMAPQLPDGTETISVTVEGEAYSIDPASVAGPSVAINATNADEHVHEVLVVRLDGDATTQTILEATGPGFPENVTFIGQLTIPAGESGTLLLAGLQPGTYSIVDLLPNESGLPNLVDGMSTTFEVE